LKSELRMVPQKKKLEACLFCYEPLEEASSDFHERCSKKMFRTALAPELPYSIDKISQLAGEVVRSRITVPGVQAKLSLHLESPGGKNKDRTGTINRLTIVGLWGEYIFKPPTEEYPALPEIEDLTMHLAEIAGIKTVPHSLIRFNSGELAYITRRVDRAKDSEKIHMEDMCQLTERLTEDKYHGSLELVGKAISRYSSNPGLDALNFFEVVLFSYLTGNADMHLKNFSLLHSTVKTERLVGLAPAYDLVATKLVIPSDKDETALTMNGKKSNLTARDFEHFAKSLGLNQKAKERVQVRMEESLPRMESFIGRSFLSREMRSAYVNLIHQRSATVFG